MTDWAAIEVAYCAGEETLRAIAKRYGITEGAVIGHQGWWLAAAALAVAIYWRGE